jgi:hypothetical protein
LGGGGRRHCVHVCAKASYVRHIQQLMAHNNARQARGEWRWETNMELIEIIREHTRHSMSASERAVMATASETAIQTPERHAMHELIYRIPNRY